MWKNPHERGGGRKERENIVAIQTVLISNCDQYTIIVVSSDGKSTDINISYLCLIVI